VRVRVPLSALNVHELWIVGRRCDNKDVHPQDTVKTALLLSSFGVLDRENALVCGVSLSAIRHWRSGRRRGSDAQSRRPESRCPRCNGQPLDEPAYSYLLGLYLGDGYVARGPREVYALSLMCSDSWPGLIKAAREAMSAVMPASRVCLVRRPGCTEVKSYAKHWPCLLPQHGPGRKHNRPIELTAWQQATVTAFPGEFARGLFHSDGCRVVNRVRRQVMTGERRYEYPRYFFSNESQEILSLCGATLDQLGVAWRFSRRNALSVARREAVARLDQFVGPKY
jgi:hypothetical protein